MKTCFFFALLACSAASAQNVGIGTTTPVFKLDVRNGSINADSVYRIGGKTIVSIKGTDNTFIGSGPGDAPLAGSGNTAVGAKALSFNQNGVINTAVGFGALEKNTTGGGNSALGISALNNNISGVENTAMGLQSLYFNNYGSYNTAFGTYALSLSSGSSYSTAVGAHALEDSRSAYNTAVGASALRSVDYAEYNTAIGYRAGYYYNHGYNNVFVGANTDANGDGYYNIIAIGQGTAVGASSRAVFGNPATNFYGGWAGWSNFSDGRFKTDVTQNVPGLSFITQLRPVTYRVEAAKLDDFLHRNHPVERSEASSAIHVKALKEKEVVVYTGFIAQEVETAAAKLGFDFSGVGKPANDNDTYSLRYAEFVVPLVKAVQEQQAMIAEMKKEIDLLKEQNTMLLQRVKN